MRVERVALNDWRGMFITMRNWGCQGRNERKVGKKVKIGYEIPLKIGINKECARTLLI